MITYQCSCGAILDRRPYPGKPRTKILEDACEACVQRAVNELMVELGERPESDTPYSATEYFLSRAS